MIVPSAALSFWSSRSSSTPRCPASRIWDEIQSKFSLIIQSGPFGRGLYFVEVKSLVPQQYTEFPIPSFIEVFRISFREFPRLLYRSCS